MTKEEIREKFIKEHPNFFEKEKPYFFNIYFKDIPLEVRKKARSDVSHAVASKKLQKKPCEKCGKIKVEAHHEDYYKPLEVKWLCVKHHAERHKELNRKYLDKMQ